VTWEGSTRKSRLPADWAKRRRAVQQRAGGRCEAKSRSGARCWRRGTDCDHVTAGDNHELSNLQWLCGKHHGAKSSAEGVAARVRPPAKRPAEEHPGLKRLPPGGR
jgi:5-methylcytosine-specific restriction protein A